MGRPRKAVGEDKNILDDMVDPVEEKSGLVGKDIQVKMDPRPGDLEWEEFVLNKLSQKEFNEKKYPTTAGLRRITPGLLGKVLFTGPVKITSPTERNGHRATVLYEIRILNKFYREDEDNPLEKILRYRGLADAWEHNIDDTGVKFSRHPSAVAETRAEGRALKKALFITSVVAEEVSEKELPEELVLEGDITDSQINAIDMQCQGLDVNVLGLVKWAKHNKIQDIPRNKATEMLKFLGKVRRGEKDKNGNLITVPDKYKGYDKDWRNK